MPSKLPTPMCPQPPGGGHMVASAVQVAGRAREVVDVGDRAQTHRPVVAVDRPTIVAVQRDRELPPCQRMTGSPGPDRLDGFIGRPAFRALVRSPWGTSSRGEIRT